MFLPVAGPAGSGDHHRTAVGGRGDEHDGAGRSWFHARGRPVPGRAYGPGPSSVRAGRGDLPARVYLWVNAAEGLGYTDTEAASWQEIDPHFHYSRFPHPSRGLPCRTGESVLSVNGDGDVRRCHFVDASLGNLYDGTLTTDPAPTPCPLTSCDCHIGYVHLESLDLYDVFRGGVVERIPAAAHT